MIICWSGTEIKKLNDPCLGSVWWMCLSQDAVKYS